MTRRIDTPAARARDEREGRSRPGFFQRHPVVSGIAVGAVVSAVVLGIVVGQGARPLDGALASGTGSASGDSAEASGADAEAVRPAETISLAFGGDIHFEQHLAWLARDPQSMSELQAAFEPADFAFANFESSITEGGSPIPGKPFTFRAPASALDSVANAGIDMVSLANNHAVDFGEVGLEDTLAAKENSPIPIIGIGRDEEEAYAPGVVDIRGVQVAFLTASLVEEETLWYHSAGPDKPGIASAKPLDRFERAVREARDEYDVVVAYVHMGAEGYTCPGDEAIQTAEALERAGADVILGVHAHRVNGFGWLGNSYTHFGLGNFVWYMSTEPAAHTGVLTVELDVPASNEPTPDRPLVTDADYAPMLIGGDGIPRPQDPATTERLRQTYEQARACTPARAEP